jgi:hypothetical protein
MVLSAEMKLRASIMRKESRCRHFRLDYPDMDTKNWNVWINTYKGRDGKMKLEKQDFDRWPLSNNLLIFKDDRHKSTCFERVTPPYSLAKMPL